MVSTVVMYMGVLQLNSKWMTAALGQFYPIEQTNDLSVYSEVPTRGTLRTGMLI